MVPVILQKAQLFDDLDLSRVKITVRRKNPGSTVDRSDSCKLLMTRLDKDATPSLKFAESGEKVVWTLTENAIKRNV